MTIALHLSRISPAARRAIASIIAIPSGQHATDVVMGMRDEHGYGVTGRHPPWSMTDTVKGRYAYPYRAAARRACGYGSRLYDCRASVLLTVETVNPDARRTLMEWVFARTFGLMIADVPEIAPAPEDSRPGLLIHANSPPSREQIDALHDRMADQQRAFTASLDACGNYLRDVEVTRIALRFALVMLDLPQTRGLTIGELFDRHAGRLRSARVFFHPDRPLLSAEVQRFHLCHAQPFWPGLLEHAEVCNHDDELRRVPWTGDVACTAALARASDDNATALKQLMRFPAAAAKARKVAML